MLIADAQQDMRDAYYGGATGAVASATVWLIAGVVLMIASPTSGIGTLVFGGMFIFPASVLLCKATGRSGKHRNDNPLGALAIQGTIWMLLAIPIAYGAALHNVGWFFPAMLLVIGGRYLTFVSLYGLKIYWALGATLALAGVGLVLMDAPVLCGAFTGALVEFAFGVAIFRLCRKSRE
jgi:hypothetical protein